MELSAGMTVSTTLRVLESTMNLTNLRLHHIVANNCAMTLPVVSLPKLAHLDLNLSNKLTPGASTPGTYGHSRILRNGALSTANPTRRNRQGKHFRDLLLQPFLLTRSVAWHTISPNDYML